MAAPDVVGRQEIADRLGVGRSRVNQIVRDPTFPEPAKLAMGHVWETADVEAWIREHWR